MNLYPLTRFANGDKCFLHLIALIEHDSFDDVCLSISDEKVSEFEDIVIPPHGTEHATLDTLIAVIHKITGKVNLIMHHVEQSKYKASWVNSLYFALCEDIKLWSTHRRVKNVLSAG